MTFDFLTLMQFFQSLPIIKDTALIILGLYFIFAFVIFNQVRVMNKIIDTPPFSKVLEMIAFFYLLAIASLFFISIVIL